MSFLLLVIDAHGIQSMSGSPPRTRSRRPPFFNEFLLRGERRGADGIALPRLSASRIVLQYGRSRRPGEYLVPPSPAPLRGPGRTAATARLSPFVPGPAQVFQHPPRRADSPTQPGSATRAGCAALTSLTSSVRRDRRGRAFAGRRRTTLAEILRRLNALTALDEHRALVGVRTTHHGVSSPLVESFLVDRKADERSSPGILLWPAFENAHVPRRRRHRYAGEPAALILALSEWHQERRLDQLRDLGVRFHAGVRLRATEQDRERQPPYTHHRYAIAPTVVAEVLSSLRLDPGAA